MADYGWNWKVDNAGSVVFDKNGKIEIVDDRENLGQQIALRLKSPKGSHPLDPEYGLDLQSIQEYKRFYRSTEELLKMIIFQCLIQDRNVKKIDYLSVEEYDGRTWKIELKVITNDERELLFSTLINQNVDLRGVIYE